MHIVFKRVSPVNWINLLLSSVLFLYVPNIFLTMPVLAAERYRRKSISFIDNRGTPLVPSVLPDYHYEKLVKEVRKRIELPRFDYNYLPEFYLTDYRARASRRLSGSASEVARILTETLGPKLLRVLNDPEVLEYRTREYVDELDRNTFIMRKAGELGVSKADLGGVLDSAYLYMITLTGSGRTLTKGSIIWFKLYETSGRAEIRVLKIINASGATIEEFASELAQGSIEIDDFSLFTTVTQVHGTKVYFPFGKLDGIHIDQKFLVYERQQIGNEIKEKKRGFFYVCKVGDNLRKRDELSCGKLIARGAEPGMEIREYPTIGIDSSILFRTSNMEFTSQKLANPRAYNVDTFQKTLIPLRALNLTFHLDIGRYLRIPQVFWTWGGDIGVESILGKSSYRQGGADSLPLYVNLHAYYAGYTGLLKKLYIRRVALLIEPLIQYQWIDMNASDGMDLGQSVFSFSPNVGLEIALRENLSVGCVLNYRVLSLQSIGTGEFELYKYDEDDHIIFPQMLLGVYLSLSIPGIW